MNRKNVVGVGLGYKRKAGKNITRSAIIVFVESKCSRDELSLQDLIPPVLEGVETDVVEIGRLRLQQPRTARVRPARPGVSIGHYSVSAGTFGCVVRDLESGEPLILSNNHVLANSSNGKDVRARQGDPVYQPGPYDGGTASANIIGRLERFVPLYRSNQEAQCRVALEVQRVLNRLLHLFLPQYSLCFFRDTPNANLVDAAVARPLDPDMIEEEIIGIGRVRGVVEARPGMHVRKSGRSSGVTSGEVIGVNVSLTVGLVDGERALFTDQVVLTAMSQPGDSGSLVVDGNNRAIGLLFAGSDRATVCCSIQNVLPALRVELP